MNAPIPPTFNPRNLRRATWLVVLIWTLAFAASVVWNVRLLHETMFLQRAGTHFLPKPYDGKTLCQTNRRTNLRPRSGRHPAARDGTTPSSATQQPEKHDGKNQTTDGQ